MIDFLMKITSFIGQFGYIVPFLAAAGSLYKTNLEKDKRYKQLFMPLFAMIFCVLACIFYKDLINALHDLMQFAVRIIERIIDYISGIIGQQRFFDQVKNLLDRIVDAIDLSNGLTRIIFAVFNPALIAFYCIVKKIALNFADRKITGNEDGFYSKLNVFYSYDDNDCRWYIAGNWGQAAEYVRYIIIVSNIFVCFIAAVTIYLFNNDKTSFLFYPVYTVIMLVEIYSFLNGASKDDYEDIIGEDDEARIISNYSILRKYLRRLFGDKLMSENTSINTIQTNIQSNDEVLGKFEKDPDVKLQAYGTYMRHKVAGGMELDQGYLEAGASLLSGRSIVFNNPFYYDLIPYIFYPMNRIMMQHRKVMIILGRHDIEDDVIKWCVSGLARVNNLPDLWKVGVLNEEKQELNVGIVTRSCVHDIDMQEANAEFFRGVGFVVLIEPSRLLTTAQIGLNSLLRQCDICRDEMVYCSIDKNCDGLIDSLSHVLQVSLTEVCASNHHEGLSSYMCWDTDDEMLQHRILPNISHYLGMGTELAIVALKNQIPKVTWYGGEAFPVLDMHWIVKQYYYDLLNYAELPATQEMFDKVLEPEVNLWGSQVQNGRCLIVEDEANNMFEMRRCFASRASRQGFVNVLSTDYLLKDYMADNNGVFMADPKAIPYIVADYAHTKRNVALRLCLRMTTGLVPEEDIRCELKNVGIADSDTIAGLWDIICECNQNMGVTNIDEHRRKMLIIENSGETYTFYRDVIILKKEYSLKKSGIEKKYYIADKDFIHLVLDDLLSARYVAEDEYGNKQYLGTELRGQMFQRHLPGQLHTFNGKYYEIRHLTAANELICRRAADQLSNRYTYRQVRQYRFNSLAESEQMGDNIVYDGMKIQMMNADINVCTPAYWQMPRHNDFVKGKKIMVNGIPERNYYNKQIMRIDFSGCGEVTDNIVSTLAVMMNEIFRTLFAEEQEFIAAVTSVMPVLQNTYTLDGTGEVELGEKCIYIIEDSQLDIGLLISVRRNIHRIFEMINDYFDWHEKTLNESLNAEPKMPPPSFALSPEEQDAIEPPIRGGLFGKLFRWIIRCIKKIFRAIGNFFRKIKEKLFGKNKVSMFSVESYGMGLSGTESSIAETYAATPYAAVPKLPAPKNVTDDESGADVPDGQEVSDAESEPDVPEEQAVSDAESEPDIYDEQTVSDAESGADIHEEQVVPDAESESDDYGMQSAPDLNEGYSINDITERIPYHLRHYLLFGEKEIPGWLDVAGTRELLSRLGYVNGELEQARRGVDLAEQIAERAAMQNDQVHYCDFCGRELTGITYDVLPDGRERCHNCSKTAVKTEKEFIDIYHTICKNLKFFYGISINTEVEIRMVNAKKLSKALGETFTPTADFDARTLGVAISKRGKYSLLIENGSPKLQATMTFVHELTHIWQYLNWDADEIYKKYGPGMELEVYEGMAKWVEIQYAYLINEVGTARLEEARTRIRDDEYGRGFVKYCEVYPLSEGTVLNGITPFDRPHEPL